MMDTERSGLDEAMDVGSSTISHLKSLKTAATFSKAGYGAALGGPFSAAIGAVIANRNQFAKILLVILAILLLPVLFIVMLPGLIFGSLTDQSDVLNSNSMISENIRASRDAIVEVLEESHEDILAEIHAAISRLPQGDTASINDPYTYSISVNANLLISQFCASQDDYKNINLNQLKKLIRENKEGLFSYDVATETVTMEVTVDGGAEGEAGTEQGQAQTQTVTFTKHTYTVVYAGDSYFADHVFHLTDKQKELAKNYAENLTAFFGTASSGIVAAINLSDEVLSYRPAVERAAAKYGMSDYVDLILAVMMQESGGRGLDVMQAAEGGFNTRYPHVPNGITDPEYSIECGIQELKYALDKAGCTGPTDLDRIKLALQGYNYGSAYIDWAMERDGGYTKENAIAYSDMMCARPSWPYDRYGDKEYVEHVLRYYQITASGGSYPANGMQIPHYLQTDYGNIPYGGGSIASSGCGPTSFAMIASYLTGTTITPIDAISWCGNSYYKPGVGTYWSYFQAASDHFGCGTVTQTSDPNQVLQALSEGHPVISSQRAGLFTSGGHFIVLRGVTARGKVCKVQTSKKLIALYDRLRYTSYNSYAQLHAKGEFEENGHKVHSLIGISIQDYSSGTGDKNIITRFHLAPEQIQFLLSRVAAGFPEFEWSQSKIFGVPDGNGYSTAQQFFISRHVYNNQQEILTSPWRIQINNGKGIKKKNHNGGTYMQAQSFISEKSAFIQLTDMDFYMLLKRADSYIVNWENYVASFLIQNGKQQFKKQQEARMAQNIQPHEMSSYMQEQPQEQYLNGMYVA